MNKIFDYAVVGLSVTGNSVAKFLARTQPQARVLLLDSRADLPLDTYPEHWQLHLGALDQALLLQADQIILSPGIALTEPAIQACKQAGIKITGDVQLFADNFPGKIIAVTGTNGKSTVCSLLAHIFKAANLKAAAGGNIGKPVLDLLEDDLDWVILELSSFQLELCQHLPSAVASIINISPDHLDRHGTMAQYIAAKQLIYRDAELGIYNADDPTTKATTAIAAEQSFGSNGDWHYQTEKSAVVIFYRERELIRVNNFPLIGAHNMNNALVAAAIAWNCKINPDIIAAAIAKFVGLDHRMQPVLERNSIRWYNDSKATNPDAAKAAIMSLGQSITGKVVLLLGGQDKDCDFSVLLEPIASFCRLVIVYGAAAAKLQQVLTGSCDLEHADSFEAAILAAQARARKDDAVLLAPACASFDMFENYRQRGDQYMALVRRHCGQEN